MPHSAGYFVLAYSWDHHCDRLVTAIEKKLQQVEQALSELSWENGADATSLLNYYKRWHQTNDLYGTTIRDISSRQFVINSLGYRGYGVNRDLFGGLGAVKGRYVRISGQLDERFRRAADSAKKVIYLPQECIEARNSDYVIDELCKKLDRDPEAIRREMRNSPSFDLDHYFHVMTRETSRQANTSIFQKMFFSAGSSSMTIMKGSTGLHNGRSARELKTAGNRDFLAACRGIFSSLHLFTDIRIDLLQMIHYALSRGLDSNAGNFRGLDFPDRNGVTFEFGNFQKEISALATVLRETGRSFHNLGDFIYNLARSYYMVIGIHPFWDGNGRAGRCLVNNLLLKKGLPPVSIDPGQEVFSLPRYGGSMEDMHNYLRGRIQKAIDAYFYERWKLESFGFLNRDIHNISFDSGFQFAQIEDRPPRIQIHFESYVVADPNLARVLADQCRVVFPNEQALRDMTVYCGFCSGPFTEWHYRFNVRNTFCIKEMESGLEDTRVFDIDFTVQAPAGALRFSWFSCCVTHDASQLIFNNKGLNYSYRLK